jgi:hypothetical protein
MCDRGPRILLLSFGVLAEHLLDRSTSRRMVIWMCHWNVFNTVTNIDVHFGGRQSVKPGHSLKFLQAIGNSTKLNLGDG